MIKHINLSIFGKVQGVGFRYFIFKKANACGLKGFVINLSGGSVYVEAEGESENLKSFITDCYQGTANSIIDNFIIEDGEFVNFNDFIIKR